MKKKKKKKIEILTQKWVGLLGVRFQVEEGGVQNYLPCLKLVRIMLETWHISTHPYVVSENIPFLLMSASCCKRLAFFVQKSTFTQ